MRFAILSFFLLLLSCSPENDNRQSESIDKVVNIDTTAVVEAAKEITTASFKTLSSNLQKAMSEGGVSNALEFCNIKAMPLTDSLASHYGIELQRASHQPRNPVNKADSLEMIAIKEYIRNIEQGRELKPVTYTRENAIIYHAPIRIQGQLCLSCHGSPGTDISQSDVEIIQELYPEDMATGFEIGELRGIWSIQFPANYFNQEDK
ncbi:DUF3365 domain-containing protein [Aliifodinibius salicampi]|uniref:DUF3365 domain-containing protein n=1 Tax=Fodinibius salicampi TaxID=1920655 RepID=A0ABT3PUB4_9BACT|nr:DUF3365 domain-containing protein [Fodinibius salicampi]MCW9711440.1 DUF3365 domain-containing protein [Fodinibius salicampi]